MDCEGGRVPCPSVQYHAKPEGRLSSTESAHLANNPFFDCHIYDSNKRRISRSSFCA